MHWGFKSVTKFVVATVLYLGATKLTSLFIVDPFSVLPAYLSLGLGLLFLFVFGRACIWGFLLARAVAIFLYGDVFQLEMTPSYFILGIVFAAADLLQIWFSYLLFQPILKRQTILIPKHAPFVFIGRIGLLIPFVASIAVGLVNVALQNISIDELTGYTLRLVLGRSIPILAMVPVIIGIYNRKEYSVSKLLGVLGLVLTLLIILLSAYRHIMLLDFKRDQLAISAKANLLVTKLNAEILDALENMELLNKFTQDTQNLLEARLRFEDLVSPIYSSSQSVRAYNLIKYVPEEQREAYEAELSRVYPGYQYITRVNDGIADYCEEMPGYITISFIYPYYRNEAAIGLELSEHQFSSKQIKETIESGEPRMSAPIRLVQGKSSGGGVVIYHANQDWNSMNQNFSDDFVIWGTVYSVDELVRHFVEEIELEKLTVAVFDTTGDEDLYICGIDEMSAVRSDEIGPLIQSKDSFSRNVVTKTIRFCKREWTLHFVADHSQNQGHLFDATMVTFVAGFWIVLWYCSLSLVHVRSMRMVESLVDERTLELKERQDELRVERDRAQAALKAKSDFLSIMSHEMRTPMNGIQGASELLTDMDLNEDQKQFVGIVSESANSMLSLIDDILDYSTLDASDIELNLRPLDVISCFEAVVQSLQHEAKAKGITLIQSFVAPKGVRILIDEKRFVQVLYNIVANAVKFTNEGRVDCTLELKQRDDSAELLVKIKDTGIGIPIEHQKKIFDVFTQADSTSTRRYEGTGLGLAICAKIVRLMNGTIDCESKEGVGTTFSITLQATVAK